MPLKTEMFLQANHRIVACVLLFLSMVSAPALGQTLGIPSEIVGSKEQLKPDQIKTVQTAVGKLADDFAAADPSGVVAIRAKLVELLQAPATGTSFKSEFTNAFVKSFAKFTSGTDSIRANNAFIVARVMANADSIDFMADNLDPDSQGEIAIRISAAAQLQRCTEKAMLSGPQLEAIAKRLVASCKKETDWVAASHEAETIAQMLRNNKLPVSQLDAIAMSLASVINDFAGRVLDDSQPQLVNALQRSLLAVRDRLSGVAGSVRGKLLTAITPSIETLAKMKGAPPAAIAADGGLAETFDAVVNAAGLLQKVRSTPAAGT